MAVRSLFISNSNNTSKQTFPIAAIITIILFIITMLFLGDTKMESKEKSELLSTLSDMHKNNNVIYILTNSRAGWTFNDNNLDKLISANSGYRAVIFSINGGIPRSFYGLLEFALLDAIRPQDAAVIFIAPEMLNRNSSFMSGCVEAFFRWKHFPELLTYGNYELIKKFLTGNSLPIMKYRTDITGAVDITEGEGLDAGEKKELVLSRFKDDYLNNFKIDDYQLAVLKKTIKEINKANAKTIIVLPPFPDGLRNMIGPDMVQEYVKKISDIASETGTELVDYVTNYSGKEYSYYDGSHFDPLSGKKYSEKFVSDLLQNLNEEKL